ncbi:hypothetical protein OHA21_11455 [Actinoplanes sp. NBC_00393]|uniref:hypothetical protein n=1 Tax=Actinoplanes sp. NBC_00393 TaxID=2975953 RepID=UPI002E22D33F
MLTVGHQLAARRPHLFDADRIWESVPAGDAWTEAALALAAQAAERGDPDQAGRLLADLDLTDGPAFPLSEAVRPWRRLGDEQGDDVLLLLDESVSSAVPTVLSRLADGDPHPERLVQAAGIESLERKPYPPDVRVEILAAVAARSGDPAGWRSALRTDPGLDLDVLTRRLVHGADLLAGLDEGQTLAWIAAALSGLEDWWWPAP